MKDLSCDLCGGRLEIKARGKGAVCLLCGVSYSTERLCEKLQDCMDMNVSSKPSTNISNLKANVKMYMKTFDWASAENTVKKILEISPTDEYANKVYRDLQTLKHFEIIGTKLVKYHGSSKLVRIPFGVTEIDKDAFIIGKKKISVDKLIIPGSIKEFDFYSSPVNVKHFIFEEGVKNIVGYLQYGKFTSKDIAKFSIPKSVEKFTNNIRIYFDTLDGKDYNFVPIENFEFPNGKSVEILRWEKRRLNLCQHCGGQFKKGFFNNVLKCKRCGKEKDYYQC